MQPYFYPYIGYFELMAAVDVFVLFSDVQYQRKGWINRNKIKGKYLTVPVRKAPQQTNINKIEICEGDWHELHLKTLLRTFGKSVLDHPVYHHYQSLPTFTHLHELLRNTLEHSAQFLRIDTQIVEVSVLPEEDSQLTSGEQKIIGICKALGADTYVNAVGGKHLYSEGSFYRHGLNLEFMPPTDYPNKNSILELCLGEGLCALPSPCLGHMETQKK